MEKSKVFRSFALTAILTGSILLAACGQTPPESENPDTSQNQPSQETPAKIALQKRAEEYENFILGLTNATSLTAEEGNQKVEIQENKLKLTQGSAPRYVETVEGESFEYVFDGGGYTKNPYTGDMTAASYQASLLLTVDVDGWTAVDAQGKLTKTGYSAEFNKDAKTLSFTSPEHTITIYKVNGTLVTLPDVKEPTQEFRITEENIEQVRANARKIVEELNIKVLGKSAVVDDIKEFYLTASDKIVDTIGVIYVGTNSNGENFKYIEAKLPRTSDITYEDIYNGTFTCSRFDATINQLFTFNVNRNSEQLNKEAGDLIKAQALGSDFEGLEWTAHNIVATEMTYNVHSVAGYDRRQQRLISYEYRINKEYNNQPVREVVEKFFVGKEVGTTYSILKQQNVVVSLENKQFLAVEQTETV